jgi:hypothetical protein
MMSQDFDLAESATEQCIRRMQIAIAKSQVGLSKIESERNAAWRFLQEHREEIACQPTQEILESHPAAAE